MKFIKLALVMKKVFRNWKYIILTTFIAFSFYSINAIISNWKTLPSIYSAIGLFGTVKFFLILLWGFGTTIKLHSYISLIIISILFGLLFSLITYKTIMIKTTTGKVGIFASVGIFIGALAPGCAACGVGILSLFGLSAAFITFLPFDGLELSILSMGILSFSVYKISEGIHKGNVCKIKVNMNERRYEK